MAATIALVVGAHAPGAERRGFFTVTPDASYPTGGYALTPGQFGLSQILVIDANSSNGAGHSVVFNTTTQKLQWFTSGATEVAGAANISAFPTVLEVVGY